MTTLHTVFVHTVLRLSAGGHRQMTSGKYKYMKHLGAIEFGNHGTVANRRVHARSKGSNTKHNPNALRPNVPCVQSKCVFRLPGYVSYFDIWQKTEKKKRKKITQLPFPQPLGFLCFIYLDENV